MLSPSEMASLGYVESLRRPLGKSDVLTSVIAQFEIKETTLNSDEKMDELKLILKEILEIGNNLDGVLNMQIGINHITKEQRLEWNRDENLVIDGPVGGVISSAVYENPMALDSHFVKLFDPFLKLMGHTDLKNQICLTSPKDVDQCKMSLSRFFAPEKFVVTPSMFSLDHELKSDKAVLKKRNNFLCEEKDRRCCNSDRSSCSLIRVCGTFKVVQEVIDDDEQWEALQDELVLYNRTVSSMEGVFFIENALSRKHGEFYYSEQYKTRDDYIKRGTYAASRKAHLGSKLIYWDMNVFCDHDNIEFFGVVLNKFDPKNIRSIIEYY